MLEELEATHLTQLLEFDLHFRRALYFGLDDPPFVDRLCQTVFSVQ